MVSAQRGQASIIFETAGGLVCLRIFQGLYQSTPENTYYSYG